MKSKKSITAFVAMSGGVDSSVAALLLQQQGYTVIGVHMRCFNVDGCATRDAEDARRVAEQLNIPLYTFNLEKEYKRHVVKYMVEGYKKGITPNPDVMCNKEIKFGLFLEHALKLGADYIATGHYVRLLKTKNYKLKTAVDINKDQSYFLWTLTQQQLQHCLFPIGEYTKQEVRALAKKYHLLTAEKKDSQGICFLGKVPIHIFLKKYIPARKGAVITPAGEVIGEHEGAELYTIGQRHGFNASIRKNISGIKKNFQPLYITEKNINTNTLIVAEGNTHPALYKKEIIVNNIHFINPLFKIQNLAYRQAGSKFKIAMMVRVRYRQPLVEAQLFFNPSTSAEFQLVFNKPQKFIAPGQSAVFYTKKGEMLGGGIVA